jgi:hypothetical protein
MSSPDGGTDAPVTVTPEVSCDAYCQRTANLQCDAAPSMDCKHECLLSRNFAPWCDAAGAASIDCLSRQPDSGFVCGATGVEPTAETCASERSAFQTRV